MKKERTPPPPGKLGEAGRKFWKKVLGEYFFESFHDLQRLQVAASCLDEIADCEKAVKQDGRFVEDRYSCKKEHPAAKASREAKTLFLRALRELALDWEEPPGAPRPPRQYGG